MDAMTCDQHAQFDVLVERLDHAVQTLRTMSAEESASPATRERLASKADGVALAAAAVTDAAGSGLEHDHLSGLATQFNDASQAMVVAASKATDPAESESLLAQANGVDLALSYVNEIIWS